jgi:hypothetical protein
MSENVSLPKGFEALAPFTETWGKLETQDARYLHRQHCTMKELKAYYDVAAPMLDQVFTHLDEFPMDALPEPEALLFRTVMGLTEAAMSIEVFNQPGVPYAPFPHHMSIDWSQTKQ